MIHIVLGYGVWTAGIVVIFTPESNVGGGAVVNAVDCR